MSNEKMRAEFEAKAGIDPKWFEYRDGDGYSMDKIQHDWVLWQAAWQAARAQPAIAIRTEGQNVYVTQGDKLLLAHRSGKQHTSDDLNFGAVCQEYATDKFATEFDCRMAMLMEIAALRAEVVAKAQPAGEAGDLIATLEGMCDAEESAFNMAYGAWYSDCKGQTLPSIDAFVVRVREAIAAHKAAQPAGEAVAVEFFAYDSECGFETFNTEAEAKKYAQDSIDSYREEAAEGWPEEVESVRWGVVLGTTKQVPVPDDGYDGSQGVADSGPFVDYVLTEYITQLAQVPDGWQLVPMEPTPKIMAAAAIAAWPQASAGDVAMAKEAALIVMQSMKAMPGVTLDMLAATLATMAPAYRAMLNAAAKPKGGE